MGKHSRMSKPACMGIGVRMGKMIFQLSDTYSKEMGVNKGLEAEKTSSWVDMCSG